MSSDHYYPHSGVDGVGPERGDERQRTHRTTMDESAPPRAEPRSQPESEPMQEESHQSYKKGDSLKQWLDSAAGTRLREKVATYQPILVLFLIALLIASVLAARPPSLEVAFMPQFAGLLLALFAMLKLFDIEGFKRGFAEYDLVTMRWPAYGYWYAPLELFLGLGFLTGYWLVFFSFVTIVVMCTTAAGIFLAMSQGRELKCACTGAQISVPLGIVSLVESVGMALMAIILFAAGTGMA